MLLKKKSGLDSRTTSTVQSNYVFTAQLKNKTKKVSPAHHCRRSLCTQAHTHTHTHTVSLRTSEMGPLW